MAEVKTERWCSPGERLVELKDVGLKLQDRTILRAVNLSVSTGSILSIVGPNGAGKTCLLKVLLGLITPTQGTVSLKRNCVVGYMPQKLQMDPFFPIDVITFLTLGQAQPLDHGLLATLSVEPILRSPLQALSGGEFQRVLLARALLRRPALLVLDEPAQGVDLIGQNELYALIAAIRDRYGCAIVMVSHDLNVVMAKTDQVICLNQHICCHGTPEHVSRDPAFVKLFGSVSSSLAIYAHRHDHQHHVDGAIIDEEDLHGD